MGTQAKFNPMRWLKGQMLMRMHGMITCKEFEDFILAYLDGELTSTQNRVFKMHLRLCRECRDYINAYQRSIELSKHLLKESSMTDLDEVPEDLIKAVLAAKNSST